MKKKSLVLFAIAAISLSAVFIARSTCKNESDFFEANVEALSHDEGGGLFGPMRSQTGNSGTFYMKLCSMDRVAYCPK